MDEKATIAALLALAQPTRLGVFKNLVRQGAEGLSAGEIAAQACVPHNTMSTHLGILQRAGLVKARRKSRSVIYAADLVGTMALLRFLLSDCLSEHPEVCGQLLEISEALGANPSGLKPLSVVDPPQSVLFLCTANSARSIMAEVMLNDLGAGRFVAHSAGSHPAHKPVADVLRLMEGLGHDTSVARSKSWQAFLGEGAPRIDIVIALCDVFQGQACPDFGKGALHVAWPLPDPHFFSGDAEERVAFLQELYSSLRRRIEMLVALPMASLDRRALKARLQRIGSGRLGALRKAVAS
jgi:protein-tyrosine-phosphatase/DNA-binding transcriptional ArsR family regulator